MNTMKLLSGRKGFVLAAIITATLSGCTTYVEHQTVYHGQPPPPAPPPVVPVQVEVVIHTESDFYDPLTPYGRWEVIGAYGRCWVPARVDPDWRPYCNGHWERTEDGWYWVSDEPWGWATYHYGRWDFDLRFGWYWVPQTQWAPAWVCWRRGDGYVGWAPLSPAARFEHDTVIVEDRNVQPRAYIFVEERRFLEPVRPRTVIVNNTTIVNKTVNITNIKVVNKTVINEGPRTQVIQQATGRSVRPVAARELRRKSEAEVASKQKAIKPGEGNVATTPTHVPPAGQDAAQEAQKRRELEKQKQIEAQQTAADKQAQLNIQRREQEALKKAQAEAERRGRELEQQKQAEAQKAVAREKQTQIDADRRAQQLEQQKQIEAQRVARAKEIEAQQAATREKQAQLEADRRARQLEQQRQAEAQKAQAEAQRRERQQQAQMEQQHRQQEAIDKADRDAEERAKVKQANKEKAEQKKAAKKPAEELSQEPSHQPPPQ